MPFPSDTAVPITVIGGYLGAGKTTVLNRLLNDPHGRRLGVIVNDFGSLAIDVETLQGRRDGDIVSLPNGCVCCSLGSDLLASLNAMMSSATPPDHIVVEASGVADPAIAAAWGTAPGFAPGGVITLAAVDSILAQLADKYVGGEVGRQLEGADLIVLTKTDLVPMASRVERLTKVESSLDVFADHVPRVLAVQGDLPHDLVLGLRPDAVRADAAEPRHERTYTRWFHTSPDPVEEKVLTRFLETLPGSILRLKGRVALIEGGVALVDVVGRTQNVRRDWRSSESGVQLVGIGLTDSFDADSITFDTP